MNQFAAAATSSRGKCSSLNFLPLCRRTNAPNSDILVSATFVGRRFPGHRVSADVDYPPGQTHPDVKTRQIGPWFTEFVPGHLGNPMVGLMETMSKGDPNVG